MATHHPHRTLVVANRTASTPTLLQEVRRRADERPTTFELLIPDVASKRDADWTLSTALKLLQEAAGAPVEGRLGGADAFESVRDAVASGAYDDVVISTFPKSRSEWLRRDLPSRIEQLGIPVTVITPPEGPGPIKAFADSFSAKTSPPATG